MTHSNKLPTLIISSIVVLLLIFAYWFFMARPSLPSQNENKKSSNVEIFQNQNQDCDSIDCSERVGSEPLINDPSIKPKTEQEDLPKVMTATIENNEVKIPVMSSSELMDASQ